MAERSNLRIHWRGAEKNSRDTDTIIAQSTQIFEIVLRQSSYKIIRDIKQIT